MREYLAPDIIRDTLSTSLRPKAANSIDSLDCESPRGSVIIHDDIDEYDEYDVCVKYDEYGPTEKVQNLMPRRYERSANSNFVDGVRVSRTTYYTQLEDDVVTPTEQVAILEPVAYKHAADTNLPFTRTTFY